ncbi:pro-neuregulin-4, membrane-bound isoform-like isoform X2 [Corythoichthys intestinalis]|uniref:pro-neuregulin-4, membrane-bound isoform-like isoform X2 n=1 Tax=Corythoichthys intestinalis TaxID=161448 RepID=UPI0025A5ED7B|nr:pro-neuregulin-4, membrane-bound isoform-like isoform X2 [Corythoichthys intestinalis]
MFMQSLKEGILSAIFLLLAASGQSAQTIRNFTPLENGSTAYPLISSQRPCGSQDQHFCFNGGTCFYPQDNNKPFCICTSGFSGNRCHDVDMDSVFHIPHLVVEQLIAITCGTAIFVFFLVVAIYCIVSKRLKKKAKLITAAPCEVTV